MFGEDLRPRKLRHTPDRNRTLLGRQLDLRPPLASQVPVTAHDAGLNVNHANSAHVPQRRHRRFALNILVRKSRTTLCSVPSLTPIVPNILALRLSRGRREEGPAVVEFLREYWKKGRGVSQGLYAMKERAKAKVNRRKMK